MDLKTDFQSYWKAIVGDDTQYDDRKAAAEAEWNAHPEKHIPIMRWLKRHGVYKGRNPYFFIQDFKVRSVSTRPPEDIFLHGKPLFDAMNRHIPLVQVDIPDRPEGRYPVCTREDAERFKLTIIKNF